MQAVKVPNPMSKTRSPTSIRRWVSAVIGFDYFICYSHDDGIAYAKELCQKLSPRFECFLDLRGSLRAKTFLLRDLEEKRRRYHAALIKSATAVKNSLNRADETFSRSFPGGQVDEQPIPYESTLASFIGAMDLSRQADFLVVGTSRREVLRVDLVDGGISKLLRTSSGEIHAVSIFHSGSHVVVAGENAIAWKIGLEDGACQRLEAQMGDVLAIDVSPGDEWIVTGGADGVLRLFDGQSGNVIRTFDGRCGRINSVAFSPDGSLLGTELLLDLLHLLERRPQALLEQGGLLGGPWRQVARHFRRPGFDGLEQFADLGLNHPDVVRIHHEPLDVDDEQFGVQMP